MALNSSKCVLTLSILIFVLAFASRISPAIINDQLHRSIRSTASESQLLLWARQSRNLDSRLRQPRRHTTTTPAPPDHHKRSTKCLIILLAHTNNITATYKQIKESGLSHNLTFTAELLLGPSERYQAHGSSKKKAEEKVSREAWALTHYTKPQLKPTTCAITEKSSINILNEWGDANSANVQCYIVEQQLGPPKEYVMECKVNNNITTRANATSKKAAKINAAEKMLTHLNYLRITAKDPAQRYNTTELIGMNPISRLHEIQSARGEDEPAFRLMSEMKDKDNVRSFIVQYGVSRYLAVGSGRKLKDAKRDAANNLLKLMGFIVA